MKQQYRPNFLPPYFRFLPQHENVQQILQHEVAPQKLQLKRPMHAQVLPPTQNQVVPILPVSKEQLPPPVISSNYITELITPKFKNFIIGLLRFKCLLTELTVIKYFDNEEGLTLLRQAFIHKSRGKTNYELLEFEGDVVVNLAVVEYIRNRYPHITNIDWNNRVKSNLISKRVLSQIAIENHFGEYVIYGDKMKELINNNDEEILLENSTYLGMYEDTVEALCGAITRILNNHTVIGVGYKACYNLISSFLNEIEIGTTYEEIYDPVSRLKLLFDSQGWNSKAGSHKTDCTIKNCLLNYEVGESQQKSIGYNLRYATKTTEVIVSTNTGRKEDARGVAFGYVCLNGNIGSKTLYCVVYAVSKKKAKHIAAECVLKRLNQLGINYEKSFPND